MFHGCLSFILYKKINSNCTVMIIFINMKDLIIDYLTFDGDILLTFSRILEIFGTYELRWFNIFDTHIQHGNQHST